MQVKKYTVAHHFCKRGLSTLFLVIDLNWNTGSRVYCNFDFALKRLGRRCVELNSGTGWGGGRIFTRGAYYLHKPPGISHKRSENVVQNTVLDKTLTLNWPISNEIYWPTFWSAVKAVANIFWFASTIVWAFSIFTIRVAVAFVKVQFAFVDIWKKISSKILN